MLIKVIKEKKKQVAFFPFSLKGEKSLLLDLKLSFQNESLVYLVLLTLKQTHNENGSVTITSPHEMAVRSQPHSPIPLSASSAAKEKERKEFINLSQLSFVN